MLHNPMQVDVYLFKKGQRSAHMPETVPFGRLGHSVVGLSGYRSVGLCPMAYTRFP